MIACYTCKQEHSIAIIREACFQAIEAEQVQRNTAKHYGELRIHVKEGKEWLYEPDGSRTPQKHTLQNQLIIGVHTGLQRQEWN